MSHLCTVLGISSLHCTGCLTYILLWMSYLCAVQASCLISVEYWMPDSLLYCTGCRTHLYTVLDAGLTSLLYWMPDSPLYCTGCRTHLYTVLDAGLTSILYWMSMILQPLRWEGGTVGMLSSSRFQVCLPRGATLPLCTVTSTVDSEKRPRYE